MTIRLSRRHLLGAGGAGLAATFLGPVPRALAQEGRVLKINTLASTAAVNVPMQWALQKGIQTFPGYGPAEVRPTAKTPQIAQEVIAGAADLGDADVASTFSAIEAGADLRVIGLSYSNTSQVIVSNADTVTSLEDIAAKGGTIAVNSIGDFMYVMLAGVLKKRGIDITTINFIEMGSSGDRARALVAGRVDAVPMHIEQAAALAKQGNYQVLVTPSEELGNWFSAVIMATGSWLEDDANKAAAVTLLKSVLTSFRKTNSDYDWYKAQLQDLASSKDLKAEGDDFLRPVWETLCTKIGAFPDNMETLTPDAFAANLAYYKDLGALQGTADLSKVIDRTYLEQAIKELA
ncbi:ABC transporter substrate-binding protein [Pseudogemmobacter sonorensis]|uniref:ABC transporter substrate-binding protein n=1 Tax=Pseudogemmobacter sonorensis TaxID=2989681 RepID=UPI00368FC523